MRLAIKDSTLKKLFALSGNLCAFPECQQALVDDNDNLIADICHIEAAEEGGERFNPGQSEEERRSIGNLIILCPTHHRVTNDTSTYTTAAVLKMKKDHEAKAKNSPLDVSEKIIKQARKQTFEQINENSGSGQQINAIGQAITIHSSGLSAPDAVELFQKLFEQNYLPTITSIAATEAQKRVDRFKESFYKKAAQQINQEELGNLADPDALSAINNAITGSAKRQSGELHEVLADLVVNRVKESNGSIEAAVLNESIEVASKLSENQLKLLALTFFTRRVHFPGKQPWPIFIVTLSNAISGVADIRFTDTELRFLETTRTLNYNSVTRQSYERILLRQYNYLFSKGYTDEEIAEFELPDSVKAELFLPDSMNGKRKVIQIESEAELKEVISKRSISQEEGAHLTKLWRQNLMNEKEVEEVLRKNIPSLCNILDLYHDTNIGAVEPTPIGVAIALSYLKQSSISLNLNFSTWIN